MSDTPPAGWYPDPQDSSRQRYWDGTAWTEHTAEGSPQAAGAAPRQPATMSAGGQPDTWTWQSIVATMFCCQFIGPVGVLNAGRAEQALKAGDVARAREHAAKAKKWTLWALGVGLAWVLLWVGLGIAGTLNGPMMY